MHVFNVSFGSVSEHWFNYFIKLIVLISSQGANLSNAVQNGQVIYLDGLKLISEALDEGNQEKSLDNQQTSNEGDNPFVNIR